MSQAQKRSSREMLREKYPEVKRKFKDFLETYPGIGGKIVSPRTDNCIQMEFWARGDGNDKGIVADGEFRLPKIPRKAQGAISMFAASFVGLGSEFLVKRIHPDYEDRLIYHITVRNPITGQ